MEYSFEPLDNPVWASLTGKLSHLGHGTTSARRFDPEVSPFAAIPDLQQDCLNELARLLLPDESVLLLSERHCPQLAGLRSEHLFDVTQMIDDAAPQYRPDDSILALSDADSPEMEALARCTQPGPFGPRTSEMGRFYGVRKEGRLIAMAGERMRLSQFTEISAVCVEEDHRGQGIAYRLMNLLRAEIRARGETPFLHVRSAAAATISLYTRMGFVRRKSLGLHQLTRVPE